MDLTITSSSTSNVALSSGGSSRTAVPSSNETDRLVYNIRVTLGEDALGVSESSLGISVKGKTTVTATGPRDLGLFVKSLLDGGAAARVSQIIISKSLI